MERSKTKVYIASTKELEDEQVFQSLYQTVSKERRDKIDRLKFPKDKRLSLAAEVLLKKALAQNGIDEFELEVGENGKPYLKEGSHLECSHCVYFNLSHSEERVLCVISDKEAGCDVEKIKDTDYKIARHFFTKEEYDLIENYTIKTTGNEEAPEQLTHDGDTALKLEEEKQKQYMFFRLWTLKESFMKATGLGMKLSLKDFSFSIREEKACVYQKVNGEQYYFKEYDRNDGYRYAVCSLTPEISDIMELRLT